MRDSTTGISAKKFHWPGNVQGIHARWPGQGKAPELTGGGLIRSLGGWKAAKLQKGTDRSKGDERLLGSSDFVEEVLRRAHDALTLRERLKASGYGLMELAAEVAEFFAIEPSILFAAGKYPQVVRARSLFCYWAVRELGETATELAKKLRLSQPAVSIAVKRGERIARDGAYTMKINL